MKSNHLTLWEVALFKRLIRDGDPIMAVCRALGIAHTTGWSILKGRYHQDVKPYGYLEDEQVYYCERREDRHVFGNEVESDIKGPTYNPTRKTYAPAPGTQIKLDFAS